MNLRSFMRLSRWMYVFVFAVACNRSDVESLPAFIQADSFSFATQTLQGSSSNGISELWCYNDGNILGVVDTPVSLPLLETGPQTITIFPGIKNNGMGTSRIRYPFYTGYDTTINVVRGETYRLNPRFYYLNSALIDASRNFEAGNSFVASSFNDGSMELLNDPLLAASGVRCVRMSLPTASNLISYLDDDNIALTGGDVAFMEMDYSCNNTFVVGVYIVQDGSSTKLPVLFLTPTQTTGADQPEWNKIYMDLGMIASQFPGADGFRLYVECTREEASIPLIFIDDIKIVK
jgi:hypothetical protein